MKKLFSILIICALLAGNAGAMAVSKTKYTLPVKGAAVLQNVPDRNITPGTQPIRHALIPGESPTTGLPWEGDYLPMLVQITCLFSDCFA